MSNISPETVIIKIPVGKRVRYEFEAIEEPNFISQQQRTILQALNGIFQSSTKETGYSLSGQIKDLEELWSETPELEGLAQEVMRLDLSDKRIENFIKDANLNIDADEVTPRVRSLLRQMRSYLPEPFGEPYRAA